MKSTSIAKALLAATLSYSAFSQGADEPRLLVMLQGSSADEMAQLVNAAGGKLTHHLPVIDAVGAELTREQLDSILASGRVSRHLDDLRDPQLPEKDTEDACKVRGHIELQVSDREIRWPLFNKQPEPAQWERLELAWPQSLGRLHAVLLDDTPVDRALLTQPDAHSLVVNFPETAAPRLASRSELSVRFERARPAVNAPPPRQRDFTIKATFQGGCTTDLVPGYENNHNDYYYNLVSGVEALHQQGITGKGVTVAVVDSGLWDHPALTQDTAGKPRVLARYDAIADRTDVEAVDESGHGTHMTSIIAHSGPTLRAGATGTYKGVAPDARLVAIKVLDREGFAHLLDIVRGIQWVVEHRERYGIRVLNLSFAQIPRWHYWEDPVNQAVMRAWADGITVVAAAGNKGPEPGTIGSPGNLPYVITVGAVTDSWTPDTRDDDYIPEFSSRGPTPAGHVKPDIVALGGHMTGLVPPESALATAGPEDILASGEHVSTGSSQAAAFTSGLAALLLQLQPELGPDDIKCKFITSAEPAINDDGLLAYSPFTQGFGYVTAIRAVTLGATGCGNDGLDILADIRGDRHFYGPAVRNEDGSPGLPGVDGMVATEPSAAGLSTTRKWGVKDHIERLDNPEPEVPAPEYPFNWLERYLAEKAAIERLASEPDSEPRGTN